MNFHISPGQIDMKKKMSLDGLQYNSIMHTFYSGVTENYRHKQLVFVFHQQVNFQLAS